MSDTHSSPATPPVAAAAQPAAAPGPNDTVCVAGIGAGQVSIPGKKGISIGDNALGRLQRILEERNTPAAGLRVAVKGGGCSGLQYSLNWDDKPREKDRVFERQGVRVFVDPKSYIYLVGTVVEYEETLMQSGFKLTNPQQKSACGCGESFTI
ncbi:MAG: HesB/IscA family protein [Myxococcales bacterium]